MSCNALPCLFLPVDLSCVCTLKSDAVCVYAGSCLVLKGNGADVAQHCVPPVTARRMSITLRRYYTDRFMGYVNKCIILFVPQWNKWAVFLPTNFLTIFSPFLACLLGMTALSWLAYGLRMSSAQYCMFFLPCVSRHTGLAYTLQGGHTQRNHLQVPVGVCALDARVMLLGT